MSLDSPEASAPESVSKSLSCLPAARMRCDGPCGAVAGFTDVEQHVFGGDDSYLDEGRVPKLLRGYFFSVCVGSY